MSKYSGDIVTLQWDPAGGTAYTTIGQIRDMGGPSLERNPIDVTTRDSTANWNEFIKGFKDGGEVTMGLVFDQALATHGSTSPGLMGDFNNDSVTLPKFKMNFPSSKTITFSGFLTGFEPDEPHDDALMADVTVKISGRPIFN